MPDDKWEADDGSRYRSLGAMRKQRSRTTPAFDPAKPSENDLRVASKIEVRKRYERLRREGHEEAAERLRSGEHVSSFADQQRLSVRLIREHVGAEWSARGGGD